MKRDRQQNSESSRIISRRALVLGTMQLGVAGVLGYRLRDLQIEQAEQFRLLSDENRIRIWPIAPQRGLIFDRNGQVIADNIRNYRVVIVKEDAGDYEKVLNDLARIIPLSDYDIRKAIAQINSNSPFFPVTIADNLSWADVSRINVNSPALPGVSAEVGYSRVYPRGKDHAHVVGYVGPVSDYDLSKIEDPDPILELPGFSIGKTGVEAKMEEPLRGVAGNRRVEVNAVGRVIRELDHREGQQGARVQLTIDSDLQRYCVARMQDESASAVVLDLERGDIRAVASAPSYDPNLFIGGISTADWRRLNEDEYRPLTAKAVQGIYPPGSTFKMVTAMAALEAGVVSPGERIRCVGHTDVYGVRFHCWKRSGHGGMNLHESLRQSCDCYYYEIGQRVGIDKISEMARRLGLGMRHDVPLSAVSEGLAPNKEWKERVREEAWRVGDTVNASIGQGYVLASALQLATMTARLATGKEINPRLVHSINGIEQPSGVGEDLGLNADYLRRIRNAMDAVVNQSGTAAKARYYGRDLRMAGKTGTSQVRRIIRASDGRVLRRNEDLPWSHRDHALFVNFAPADNPKFAVAVVVEHGGGGSTAAAPIARDITLQALYEGNPPLDVYPSGVRSSVQRMRSKIESYQSVPDPTVNEA